MVVKAIRKAVDEFEIKRVHDEGSSSRSLVFKISKRMNKASMQESIAAGHKVESRGELEVSSPLKQEPCLSSDPTLHDNTSIKPMIKTKEAEDTVKIARPVSQNEPKFAGQVAEKFGAVLRRTSKRIVLRVREQNIEVNEKALESQKTKDSSSETPKRGYSCGKMGRRRGGRKPHLEEVNPKPERRGRGRPRTVNRDQPVEKVGKIVCFKRSKTPKKSVAVIADSSSVWTLVPKEFVNSEYFRSHILKVQERPPKIGRPKKASRAPNVPEIPEIPSSSRKSMKLQFPNLPPVRTKPAVVPGTAPPTRPTVIYFNTPKNGVGETEANPPFSSQVSIPNQQRVEAVSSAEFQSSPYLRQHYGSVGNDAALGHIYNGISQPNLRRDDHLIRDMMSGLKQPATEFNPHFNRQYSLQRPFPLGQENKVESNHEFLLQTNGYDKVSEPTPVQSNFYISCRQVIVDAIRMLYDEESILGYA